MKHLVLLMASALCAQGCGEALAQEEVEVVAPCASTEDGVWESSPWRGESETCFYLPFSSRTTYRFLHDLGRQPRSVDLYVSFDDAAASVAPPAGDMSRILEVTDEVVVVQNQTNEDFFVRVVLR